MANKICRRTRTKLSTSGTDLGSVVRFDSNNFNSFSFGFVLDKILKLIETPVAYPIVHPLSSTLISYSFQVFHNNLVSVEIGNNVFAYIVVYPSHVTSFSSREIFEKSLAGTSAFGLQFVTQMFELPFSLLDVSRIIKPAVRTDGKVVYSEVNAQNNVLRTVVLLSGSNLFRECEEKETSAFLIHSQKAFINFPVEVISITRRDIEVELLPIFEQPQNKSVAFEISTSWKIVSDRSSFYDWIGFSLLDHATSLSYTSDSYLSWEFESLPDCMVDGIMELEVLSYFMLPSIINAELQCFGVSPNSGNYLWSWIDSNFGSYNNSHKNYKTLDIFKCFGGFKHGRQMAEV